MVPIFKTTVGIFECYKGRAVSRTYVADNDPTEWAATTLPPGLAINASTGLISGTPTAEGEFLFRLDASNADGAAEPIYLSCLVLPSADDPASNSIDLRLAVDTRKITQASATDGNVDVVAGDVVNFRVQTEKGGVPIELPGVVVSWVLSPADDVGRLAEGDDYDDLGDGVIAVQIPFTDAKILKELRDVGGDYFPALLQFRVEADNPYESLTEDRLDTRCIPLPVRIHAAL